VDLSFADDLLQANRLESAGAWILALR